MPSVMQHLFSEVPRADIPRSRFDRSRGLKTTFNAGDLVPIYVDEALPGDTFNMDPTMFGRLATPLHPFMDNLFMDTFFFAVPYRLVWDNWERFNGAQDNPDDSTDFILPTMTSPAVDGYANGSLSDYFGIPTDVPDLEHMSLVHRAYNLIWNEWFRDQNLQDSVVVDKDDGPDNPADYVVLKRGKRHDYFTSCLPWPQKGPAVDLPLGTSAPVLGLGVSSSSGNPSAGPVTGRDASGSFSYDNYWGTSTNNFIIDATQSGASGLPAIYADLSEATAATINQLREAFQVQRLYERDARGGTRYIEILKSHFGVTSPDSRLQRPEYLGGRSVPVNVSPVAQTSATEETSPQGNLAAFGVVNVSRAGFVKSFTEHTLIIGLVSIRADLSYQQGLHRMWSRSTRFDFYWPALAHLGEQAVLNKEIFAVGSAVPDQDDGVFGYQERWAEYRYGSSMITGQYRSNFAQSLDAWHLALDFDNLPVLGSEFIEDNPPVDRVIAVPSYPHMQLDCFFRLNCARPMPLYSVPGLIDHF